MDVRDLPPQRMNPELIVGGPVIEITDDPDKIPISSDLMLRNNIHVLKVVGDALIGDHLLEGDHVIVEKRSASRDGELVVALIRGCKTTLKRLHRDGHRIRLEQTDGSDDAMVFDEKDVTVQGVVVGILRKYRG